MTDELLRLFDLYAANLLQGANAQAAITRDKFRAIIAELSARQEPVALRESLKRIVLFTSATPSLSESGCGRLLAQIEHEATKALAAPLPEAPADSVLYCHECGHIGPVSPPALACCPDNKGRLVHRETAEQARRGFLAALPEAPDTVRVPREERAELVRFMNGEEGYR